MNLHDLDVPEGAFLPGHRPDIDTEPFFTRADLERARATLEQNPGYTYRARWPRVEDVVREVRQERDGYWTYTTRVMDLGLPRRIDGVFLDTET